MKQIKFSNVILILIVLMFFLNETSLQASEDGSFRIKKDGKITIEGFEFKNMNDYLDSNYFRLRGKRCKVKRLSFAAQKTFLINRHKSDCTTKSTTIQNEYWPSKSHTIPVVFHIIHKADGTGNISDQSIAAQVSVLNEDYGAMQGTMGSESVNTKIQFKLMEITRTVNDDWFNDENEREYKAQLGWDQSHYMNVYINSANGYLGYAYFPQDAAGTVLDGIVLLYSAIGGRNNGNGAYDQGRTLVHEAGHYLGLEHTFAGYGCYSGYTSGDLIADTNSESDEHYGCSQSSSCGTPDEIHNYMNYTDDTCMFEFTSEQANRAYCGLVNYRPQLGISVLPPKNFRITQVQNNLIFQIEYINNLTWEKNTENTSLIVNYILYRKFTGTLDINYVLLSEMNSQTFTYIDRLKKKSDKYTYKIIGVDENGLQSAPVIISN